MNNIDFDAIDKFLRNNFCYVDSPSFGEVAFGKSYYVGENADRAVKVDLYMINKSKIPYG